MEYIDKMLQYVTMQFVGHFGHGVSPMCQGVPHELGHYMAPSWLSYKVVPPSYKLVYKPP